MSREGPLAGVLVLDLSRVLAGPFCTMLLADLGARVVKVEHPDGGDVTRGWGPPWEPGSGLSAYYLAINRNKESIALDLSTEVGAESVRILARGADVLVENFVPGGLEKLGLSLQGLRRENPRLVTASITGFGRAGEEAELPGFDLLAQAAAGLMAITGSEGATKVGVAVSDLFAGLFALAGIVALLRERESTGRGGHVEADLFSSTLAALINVAQTSLVTGVEAKRFGNAHPQIVPYRPFAASDGEFIVAAGTDRQFARLAGVPAGPLRGPLEALRCGLAGSLGAVVSAGGVPFVASPIRIEDRTPPLRFPPKLDEHGEALRREFGLPG